MQAFIVTLCYLCYDFTCLTENSRSVTEFSDRVYGSV